MKRLIWLAAALMATQARAADLSPGHWPAAERARLERAEMSPYPPAARALEGRQELVSATLSPIATHVGMEALRQGGTAADAAVAVALTQVATNLGSVISYAGIAELLYYDARTGRTYAMDAGWAPYAGETDPGSIPAMDVSLITGGAAAKGAAPGQGRKTLTPGFMAGMAAMHGRFGRLPFGDLFQPAIWYAETGAPATPLLGAYFGMQRAQLSRTEEGRAFLALAGDGRPGMGDRIVQPGVATLLRGVAKAGPNYMYRGPWAQRYVEVVRREGGAVTPKDLARYRVIWEEPLRTRFAGAEVIGPGRTNASACSLLLALNLLDAQGGGAMAPYWRDANAFAAYARATRYSIISSSSTAMVAYERSLGLQADCEGRLVPAYAAAMAPKLEAILAAAGGGPAGHHSASVVVVDRWGNVAALVHSINATMWGDTGIVVDGVAISGAGGNLRGRLAAVKPGQHAPNDGAPVIALRNGKPVLAAASIGSSLVG